MVEFKTWKDYYKFIQTYANASCINCHYTGKPVESDEDSAYKRTFCTRHISMVEFAFMFICAEWIHEDSGRRLKDYGDCPLWKVDLDVLDDEKVYSFEEATEEIIKNHEELKK